MKPTSIIFLIFSVILVFAGLSICSIAEDVAKAENTPLFMQEQTEDGNLVTKFPIDDSTVTKLALGFNGAHINVFGGASESYVELVNFPINTFTHSVTNGIFSVDDNVDLLTLFNLTGKGTQFHGLRHYLNTANFRPGPKAVNVYLTDQIALQEMEIIGVRSDITVQSCSEALIYKLSTDVGDITLLNVESADLAELAVTKEGSVAIQHSTVAEIEAEIMKGNCSFVAKQTNMQTYDAATKLGNIFVDGDSMGASYTSTSAVTLVSCVFRVEEGDVIISELN